MAKTIICFGDSNTHGYDSATDGRFDEHTRWTGVLQDELGPEYLIREEGLGGRNTVFDDPLTEGMSGLSTIAPILMTHEPVDLLILMLGTNDTKARFGATPANIAKGLRRLVRKAQALTEAWRNGQPRILIVCPPPILPIYKERMFAGEMGEGADVKSRALPPLYESVAKELHCGYLDAGTIPGVEMSSRYCGMHMEPPAHKALADALAGQVRAIFAEEKQ